MAIIVGDVTGLQWRHHPQNIFHLVEKIKSFPLENLFEIPQHIKNSRERFYLFHRSPPRPSVPRWWDEFVRVNQNMP